MVIHSSFNEEPTAIIISAHFNNLISIYGEAAVISLEMALTDRGPDVEYTAGYKALGVHDAATRLVYNLRITYPDFDFISLLNAGYNRSIAV